jgi:Ca-activated chloride channel family protein
MQKLRRVLALTLAKVPGAAFLLAMAGGALPLRAAEPTPSCREDAMFIFDASRSMAAADASVEGLRRIDSVRAALAAVLPRVAPKRRIGLITYGPGSATPCANVKLHFAPIDNAQSRIEEVTGALRPEGRTPLTRAVRLAADVLNYRERPTTIVLLTDGEETCGASPCDLARALKRDGAKVTVHVASYRIKASIGSDGVFQSRCLADETGGLYAAADTTEELTAALQEMLGCPLVSDGGGSVTTRSAASVR